MNAEFLQISRFIELAATGDPGGNDVKTITLESGTPYRHLAMYLNGSATAVTAQPLFGGANDGAATNVTGAINQKIYQIGVDEVRPSTRGLQTHPDDGGVPVPLKSELRLTNTDAAVARLSVFIVAAASPGGA